MNIQDPQVLSAVVVFVGLIGFGASVFGLIQVNEERKLVEGTRPHVGGLIKVQSGEITSQNWLTQYAIPEDCHVADHVIAFVGGWRSGRLPTLGELHNLAARRERNRIAGRIASGIVATLLIFGIAGTLLAIHPVLKSFNIPISPDGFTQEAAKGAADVMSMIHGLGTAFSPSLWALGATIAVVSMRGLYGIHTSRLSHELDRFSLEYLFPIFRLPSFAESFVRVEANLAGLVETIKRRDKGFEDAVGLLKNAAESFEEAAPKLKKTADAVAKASDKLAADAELVLKGLTEQFSGDSELLRTLKKSASAMERAASEASRLVAATTAIDGRHQQLALSFTENAQSVKQSMGAIAVQVAAGVASGKGVIVDAARGVVDDVARAAKARVAKEVEPIIVSLGNAGSNVASVVNKLGQDVSAITGHVRASADAASQAVNESSRITAELLKRSADEASARNESTKRELENASAEIKTSVEVLKIDLTATLKKTDESFSESFNVASAQIASAANEMSATQNKLEDVLSRIENIPTPSAPPKKKGMFNWLRRKS